jgi:hypothetical protein
MNRTATIDISVTARNRPDLDLRAFAQAVDDWWSEDNVADMALHRLLADPGATAMDSDMVFSRDGATVTATLTLTVTLDVPRDWSQTDLERRLDDWFDVDPDVQNALRRKLGEVTTVDADLTIERRGRVP